MDVRDLKYPDKSFDFIIDKSTIDALLCGDSSFLNVAIMLKEVQRVLNDNGIYMIISYGKPENRVLHLERRHLDFEISIYTIKKESDINENNDIDSSKVHYVYVCKKGKNSSKASEEYDEVYNELLHQEIIDKELEYAEIYEDEEGDEINDVENENYDELIKNMESNEENENIKSGSKSMNVYLNKNINTGMKNINLNDKLEINDKTNRNKVFLPKIK